MKIGILTFHRAHNYGAVLQCYALQEVLKSMGHEVSVIDYRQPHIESIHKVFTLRSALYHIIKKGRFSYITKIQDRRKRKEYFESFSKKNLHLTELCTYNIPTQFDCYIIGSDQLWSKQCMGDSFDKIFLGDFLRNPEQKLVGYAISSNLTSLNSIEDKSLKQIIENFTLFSMREEKNVNLVKEKTGLSTVETCIDPTLLTNPEIWNNITNSKWASEDYILIYQVRLPSNQPNFLQEKAQELSKEFNHCKIITISTAVHSVEDFLSLFKYAKYVLTTSFHATVFSIIFETPFYAIKLKDGHDDRYENLLSQIAADDLCVNMDFQPVKRVIDFTSIKKKLKEIQVQSFSFLERI